MKNYLKIFKQLLAEHFQLSAIMTDWENETWSHKSIDKFYVVKRHKKLLVRGKYIPYEDIYILRNDQHIYYGNIEGAGIILEREIANASARQK